MTFKIRGSLAAAALAGATWAVSAAAADVAPAVAATTGDAKAPAANTTPAASAGMRVFRDPSTGQLRAPTDEEMKAILDEERAVRAARGQAEPAGRGAPLSLHRYANGMRSAVLGPEYRTTLRAERTADGKLVITHANEQPNAQQRPTE